MWKSPNESSKYTKRSKENDKPIKIFRWASRMSRSVNPAEITEAVTYETKRSLCCTSHVWFYKWEFCGTQRLLPPILSRCGSSWFSVFHFCPSRDWDNSVMLTPCSVSAKCETLRCRFAWLAPVNLRHRRTEFTGKPLKWYQNSNLRLEKLIIK